MIMIVAFVLTLALVAIRWPRQLLGSVGLILGYLVGMGGLCLLADHVFPSTLLIRLGMLAVGGALFLLAAGRQRFRDTTPKAVTIYFIGLTTISALLLGVTEAERTIGNKRPVIRQTAVSIVQPNGSTEEIRRESQTYTEVIEYRGERLLDCWFTVISAGCVTGLIVTDTQSMSTAGQVIVMLTIKGGGWGIIFFTVLMGMLIAREKSMRTKLDAIHAEALDVHPQFASRMLRQVIGISLTIETIAFLIMGSYLQWFVDPALLRGYNPWYWALFHSISAFNNAGFSLMNDNLTSFVTDPVITLTIASEIILGGLGFGVIIRLWTWLRVKFFWLNGRSAEMIAQAEAIQATRLQTFVVLQGTFFLLKIGTLAPLLLDWGNPIYAKFNLAQRIMICFFHSVSARTAGFNSVDYGKWGVGVTLIYLALMFIGAGPQGTAGGIKITTSRLLIAHFANWFRQGYTHAVIRRKGEDWLVHRDTMIAATRLCFSSLMLLGVSVTLISIFEAKWLNTVDPTFTYLKVLYEVVSAFGTVGNSMGYEGAITSFAGIMSEDSKLVLMLTMLIGRLGPLTILALLPWRHDFGVVDLLVAELLKKLQVG